MASAISTTRVFNNRNSQAVRIPAERGQTLLQALQALGEVDEQFIAALEVDEQFIAALEAEQAQSPPMQERPLAPTIYDRVVE